VGSEDWKTYKKVEIEIKKDITDEVHEFLTKVFNVYMIKMPPQLFKQIELVRDKLIPLTSKLDQDRFTEFCDIFSKVYRNIMTDKNVSNDVKNILNELASKTNSFFSSKGMQICVREIRYYGVRIYVSYNGKPLPDTTVVAEMEGRAIASSKTDTSGFAKLELPEGRYIVYVYRYLEEDKYVYEEKSVSIPQESEISFELKEAKTLGEIERERGGKPLIKEITHEEPKPGYEE